MAKKHKFKRQKRRTTNQIKKYKNKESLGLYGAISKGIRDGYKERRERAKEEKKEKQITDKHGIPVGVTKRKHTRWYWR